MANLYSIYSGINIRSVELPVWGLFSDVGLGTTCRGHGHKYNPITESGRLPCTACPDIFFPCVTFL